MNIIFTPLIITLKNSNSVLSAVTFIFLYVKVAKECQHIS